MIRAIKCKVCYIKHRIKIRKMIRIYDRLNAANDQVVDNDVDGGFIDEWRKLP